MSNNTSNNTSSNPLNNSVPTQNTQTNPQSTTPVQPVVTNITSVPAINDSNPQEMSNIPPAAITTTITSPHAPQKYGGKKVLATIFGLLLVVGGVVTGVALVQRQQNISEQAQTTQYDARCSEVKAYDANWNQLNTTALEDLVPGTVVRFTVSGTATSGTFDRARFTVNGVRSSEVTAKKPGTEEYYYEYTVPENTTNFTVKGEVHHSIWGWI